MHELNLLPRERRVAGHRQRLIDLASQVLRSVTYGLLGVTVIGLLILGSVQVIVVGSSANEDSQLSQVEQDLEALASRATERNDLLASLASLQTDHVRWTDFMAALLEGLPAGTTLTQLTGSDSTLTGGFSIRAAIDGQVPSRTTLAVLEDALRQLPGVVSVESPITNLISPLQPVWHYELVFTSEEAVEERQSSPVAFEQLDGPSLGPNQPAPPRRASRFSWGRLVTYVSGGILLLSLPLAWWQRRNSTV